MGMFSFAKDIGEKIFNRDDAKHDAKAETKADANTPVQSTEPSAQSVANILLRRIQQQNLNISNLKVKYNGLQILQKSVVRPKPKRIAKKLLSLSVTCKTSLKLLIISILKKMRLNLPCTQ